MTDIDDLLHGNATFEASAFDAALTINPTGNVMVIGCVDPRVDPAHIFSLANGQAVVLRNVGGRVTPGLLKSMGMLSRVALANATTRVPGPWNLIVLHHTDCGMTDLAPHTDLLAEYFAIPASELAHKAISDPYASVRVDTTVIQAAIHADDYYVTGMVYDVATGRVEVIVPPTPVAPAPPDSSSP
ncbi:carbonic anhydrase [Mycolicibacterium sp. 018/SC-01/001]|uniref:carbonic anhydrase n=1 Tax=Mycolicibacterium sp. 018/SC-01/001 TaxID=2592069 RepID=UPI0011810DEE|nr:carbonic anhydrase [Mycolicibacterium sp. 018/SC-01/001]TRW89158.1 carbonic anhydrase [Mycolicibacterium sp. 018/SC-01/001]